MDRSQNWVTTIGLGAAIILVAFIAFLMFGISPGTADTESYVKHSRTFLALEDLLLDFKEAQLSYQTYLTTGQPEQLKVFDEESKRVSAHVASLHSPDDPGSNERFRYLELQINGVMDRLRLSSSIRQEKGAASATRTGLTTRETREVQNVGKEIASAATDELKQIVLKATELSNVFAFVRIFAIFALSILLGTMLYIARSGSPRLAEAENRVKSLEEELTSSRKEIERLANVDYLTDVLNVKGFEQMLLVEQNRILRAGGQLVAVLCNCDNFKQIAANLGHNLSDTVLREMAQRISSTLRPSDHVARLSGDEFLVLLTDTQLAYAMRVAERIRRAISDSALKNTPKPMHITASIGVAALPQTVRTVDEILGLTRTALRRSKMSGKNRVSLSRDAGNDSDDANRDIVDLLNDGSHFRVVYQPIIDLATEKVAGYEIFSRGPDGAFESPNDFFRVCIEHDILTNVDLQCLRQCVEAASHIQKSMRFHINVFPSTIVDTSIDAILSLFPEDREGKTYCIEISEPQLTGDPSYLRDQINALREAGILVAIDDVGFGRSSLDSLIILEPDIVKVDRKYVTGIAQEPAKKRLLKRVVNVAKSLGAEIVAEGIESEVDLPVLREIGINYGQGYFWGALLEVVPEEIAPATALSREERRA
ncbi:MAG TPA: EAL domain-containing protein [Oculatellaceae cyanobacterium]